MQRVAMAFPEKLVTYLIMAFLWMITDGYADCYFSTEYQGEFMTQLSSGLPDVDSRSASGHRVQYATVHIFATGIPIWGECHKRQGKNVILRDSAGSTACFRCLQLRLRSYNVLQVFSTEEFNRCYTQESLAALACPTHQDIKFKNAKEIILFREPATVMDTLCPMSGQHRFSYLRHTEYPLSGNKCHQASSFLSACPTGTAFKLAFRECSFPDREVRYRCLGHWDGRQGERFVALLDTDPEAGLRFRCALISSFSKSITGSLEYNLALSSDSTCRRDLFSASLGHETLKLAEIPQRPIPNLVRKGNCKFPDWLQGSWEELSISGGSMQHIDKSNMQPVTSECIKQSSKHKNRYLIYTRSPCGDEQYNCIWFEPRSVNVVEYQLGLRPSTIPSFQLCDNDHFLQRTWNTRARQNFHSLSSCPIAGEYTGVLPDAPSLCAKMSSDCNNPDVMFFAITDCDGGGDVYEDREYQCIGQWEEAGTLYTYAHRRDATVALDYECFVGAADANGTLFLMEAGADCRRGLKVQELGMRLEQRSTCDIHRLQPAYKLRSPARPWYIPERESSDGHFIGESNIISHSDLEDLSTNSWQPIRADKTNSSTRCHNDSLEFITIFLTVFLAAHLIQR